MTIIKDMTIQLDNNGKGIAQGTLTFTLHDNKYDAIKTVEINENTTIAQMYRKMVEDDFRLWYNEYHT